MTTASEIASATSDVSTCAHSTAERAMGIDWNRSTMPPLMSMKRRYAVYETPLAIVMMRMPGNR